MSPFVDSSRDWQVDLGPAYGAAGTTRTLSAPMQCPFRGEKVFATDTSPNPGHGVRVMQLLVGQKPQRPVANGSTLAAFFGPQALGNGVRWDTCDRGLSITMTVSYVESCTLEMSIFGKAVS